MGYIIGKANAFGENTATKWPYSFNFDQAMDFIFGRQVSIKKDYSQYDVSKYVMTSEGGMMELYNHRTGDWVLFNSAGTIIAVTQHKLYLRCGSPPPTPAAGPVAFSAITLTEQECYIKSPNIVLDGKQVTTGHHGLHLVGTVCEGPIVCYGGSVLNPIIETHG